MKSTETPRILEVERLTIACLLSTLGGFLDVYTYLYRGHVFANAVTGNIVLFGMNLAQGKIMSCAKYFVAIFAYVCGVFAAILIQNKAENTPNFSGHHRVLLLEILCLLPIIFIPFGKCDFIVNSIISFVCALQVQTFRRVHGHLFASTMCTGNLRSGTEALYQGIIHHDKMGFHIAGHYAVVILCFILGASGGALLLHAFGHRIFLLIPAGLAGVLYLIRKRS